MLILKKSHLFVEFYQFNNWQASYNLVSHIIRIDRDLGRQALTGMGELLAEGGELVVGPTNAKMASNERWKTMSLSSDATFGDIAAAQRLLTSSNIYYAVAQ